MTLHDDVYGALPELRAAAESRMTDTCEVGYEAPGEVLNEDTGLYEPTFTAVYTGRCRFKPSSTAAGEIDAAGQLLVEQDNELHLPIEASAAVQRDMQVRITGSLTDPGLAGTRARIKSPAVGSYMTARRFSVEVTS